MDDNRLYILLTRSNEFLEDSSAFEEAVRDTFSGDEQVLADYIVKLHSLGVVETIDDALELDQDLMDDLLEDIEDQFEETGIRNERAARRAVRMWFEAYGEEMLGLLCSAEVPDEDDTVNSDDPRDIALEDLELSVRSYNCLRRAGIKTLGEIADKTPEDMMHIRNLGRKSLEEVLAKLHEYGLSLRESETDEDEPEDDMLCELIRNLDMSVRTINVLRRNHVDTVRELCCCSENEVDHFRLMGRQSKEELVQKMDEIGVSFRSDSESKHLYLYPDDVKKIAAEKESSWEYLLFIGAGICNYKWLQKYRAQKVTLWQNDDEDDDDRIGTRSELVEFLHDQMEKLQEFVSDFGACMNDSIKPSFGEPGEPGDEYEIIDATEMFFGIYKSVIAWRLSFKDVNADEEYRDIIEQLCLTAESLCENIDVMYQKLLVAKKKIEDIEAGILDPSDTEIDINIKFEINMDGLQRALHDLTGEDFDDEEELDDEQVAHERDNNVGGHDTEDNLRDIPIEELELSVCSYNCLRRAGIRTLGDIIDKTLDDMMKVRNLGRKSLEEVLDKLRERGITLREEAESETGSRVQNDLSISILDNDEIMVRLNEIIVQNAEIVVKLSARNHSQKGFQIYARNVIINEILYKGYLSISTLKADEEREAAFIIKDVEGVPTNRIKDIVFEIEIDDVNNLQVFGTEKIYVSRKNGLEEFRCSVGQQLKGGITKPEIVDTNREKDSFLNLIQSYKKIK